MKKQTVLENEIDRLEEVLQDYDSDSKEYSKVLKHLERLHALNDKNKTFKFTVSGDTLVLGTVNVLGILLVLHYEKLDVVSSKAFSLISKLRI